MLSGPKRRIALGILLLAITSLGLAFAGGRWLLLETRSHVVVRISNVDGIAKIFVDCHLVARVESGGSDVTADMGWLDPDDRIFLSVTSIDSTPTWAFFGTANGDHLLSESSGNGKLSQITTTAHAVVYAKAFSADGAELGAIGCQPANLVAIEGPLSTAAIEGYAWSPDDKAVAEVTGARSSYRRPNDFYDCVDAIGGWSLVALAVLGAAAAILTPAIRRLAWSHKGRLAGGTLAILGLSFLIPILPTILTLGGILLLLWVALRLLGPACPGLKSAAGPGGP
jgi:hypothetical protein